MRKFLSLLACVCLLICLLPNTVQATQTDSQIDSICKEARRVYYYSLSTAGRSSFQGFCGLMVSHQLYHMGINRSIEVYDGNKQYDVYSQKEQTSGGFYPTAYPADTYTLAQALNAITRNGTRDAYNILVGFEKTNTASGAIYGHACMINAIIDGTVYFVESFYTSMAGPEGAVIACSIEEMDAYFSPWMTLEGVVHFGNGDYADRCQSYETDIFVRTRFASALRSQPCVLEENGCQKVRDLMPGEILHVLGVFQNDLGETYYQVVEDGQTGYVMANATVFLQVNQENMMLHDHSIPVGIPQGREIALSGYVSAIRGNLKAVTVKVTDTAGNVLRHADLKGGCVTADLSNIQLGLDTLEKGTYEISIYGTSQYITCQGPALDVMTHEMLLYQNILQIGKFNGITTKGKELADTTDLDGFVWRNGKWYVYQNGMPRTGWFTYFGITYYANEEGLLATNWTELDGKLYYFTENGCLYTGYLTLANNSPLLFENGLMKEIPEEMKKPES